MIDKEYLWKTFVLGVDHKKIDGANLWQYRDVKKDSVNELLFPYMKFKLIKQGGLEPEVADVYIAFILDALCDRLDVTSDLYVVVKKYYDSLPPLNINAKSKVILNFAFFAFKQFGYSINKKEG